MALTNVEEWPRMECQKLLAWSDLHVDAWFEMVGWWIGLVGNAKKSIGMNSWVMLDQLGFAVVGFTCLLDVLFLGVSNRFSPEIPQCHSEECISVSSIDVLIIYGGSSIPKGFNHVRIVEEPRGTETLCWEGDWTPESNYLRIWHIIIIWH